MPQARGTALPRHQRKETNSEKHIFDSLKSVLYIYFVTKSSMPLLMDSSPRGNIRSAVSALVLLTIRQYIIFILLSAVKSVYN